ncbi:MAG: hypothetical protein U0599_08205 [Vicinamibacteria bacterium]
MVFDLGLQSTGDLANLATIVGASAASLGRQIREHFEKRTADDQVELRAARLQAARKVVESGLHRHVLARLYPSSDLRREGLDPYQLVIDGNTAPTGVVVLHDLKDARFGLHPKDGRFQLRSGEPRLPPPEDVAAAVAADVAFRGLRVWNDPVFRLVEAEEGGRSFAFGLDDFFSYRYGIGALPDELVQALVNAESDIENLLADREKLLPFREIFMADARRVAAFRKRLCPGGVSMVVAMRRPKPWNDYVVPVQRRASVLAGNQAALGVVPHAYHQPMVDPNAEIGLFTTAMRELYEELFGGDEVAQQAVKIRRLRPDWYMLEAGALKWLSKNPRDWSLSCTLFGIDLGSGNWDASLLLKIDSTRFWTAFGAQLRANWEVAEELVPLVSTQDGDAIGALVRRREWTTVGLTAFCRALVTLRAAEPQRVARLDFDERIG